MNLTVDGFRAYRVRVNFESFNSRKLLKRGIKKKHAEFDEAME